MLTLKNLGISFTSNNDVIHAVNDTSLTIEPGQFVGLVGESGSGKSDLATGIGFFDHMLDQLARHSMVDLRIRSSGDLHIDNHHTVEDVGICIGKALSESLGDKNGIKRYASTLLPMDDALIQVALDLSGRSYLSWQVKFPTNKIGTFDTELFEEFFKAFTNEAKCNLHIERIRSFHYRDLTSLRVCGQASLFISSTQIRP